MYFQRPFRNLQDHSHGGLFFAILRHRAQGTHVVNLSVLLFGTENSTRHHTVLKACFCNSTLHHPSGYWDSAFELLAPLAHGYSWLPSELPVLLPCVVCVMAFSSPSRTHVSSHDSFFHFSTHMHGNFVVFFSLLGPQVTFHSVELSSWSFAPAIFIPSAFTHILVNTLLFFVRPSSPPHR